MNPTRPLFLSLLFCSLLLFQVATSTSIDKNEVSSNEFSVSSEKFIEILNSLGIVCYVDVASEVKNVYNPQTPFKIGRYNGGVSSRIIVPLLPACIFTKYISLVNLDKNGSTSASEILDIIQSTDEVLVKAFYETIQSNISNERRAYTLRDIIEVMSRPENNCKYQEKVSKSSLKKNFQRLFLVSSFAKCVIFNVYCEKDLDEVLHKVIEMKDVKHLMKKIKDLNEKFMISLSKASCETYIGNIWKSERINLSKKLNGSYKNLYKMLISKILKQDSQKGTVINVSFMDLITKINRKLHESKDSTTCRGKILIDKSILLSFDTICKEILDNGFIYLRIRDLGMIGVLYMAFIRQLDPERYQFLGVFVKMIVILSEEKDPKDSLPNLISKYLKMEEYRLIDFNAIVNVRRAYEFDKHDLKTLNGRIKFDSIQDKVTFIGFKTCVSDQNFRNYLNYISEKFKIFHSSATFFQQCNDEQNINKYIF